MITAYNSLSWAFKRMFPQNQVAAKSEQTEKISDIREIVLKPELPITARQIKVNIPNSVKVTLDKLFEGSSFSLDGLPFYPFILEKNGHDTPQYECMKAPIMQGVMEDKRPFIAIKLNCDVTDEMMERADWPEMLRTAVKGSRLKQVLMLYQTFTQGPLFWGGDGQYMWDQLSSDLFGPVFFTWNFTYPTDGYGPTATQEKNFSHFQTLLKKGEACDKRGLEWKIDYT